MPDHTPDPRATVELLTRLERVKEKLVPPICVYEEEDAALAEVVIDALPSIIHHLRRLVEVEAAAQAVCDPEVKRWSGVYSGEPWYSVPGELLTALANALAHREGQ